MISPMPGRCGRRVIGHAFTATVANQLSLSLSMLMHTGNRLRRLCGRLRCPLRRRHKSKVTIHSFSRRFNSSKPEAESVGKESLVRPNSHNLHGSAAEPPPSIRIATFNVAMFSMAPAVTSTFPSSPVVASSPSEHEIRCKSANDRPRSILKQSSLTKPKMRVSINLPDNEIERKSRRRISDDHERKGKAPAASWPSIRASYNETSRRCVLDVLREVGADIIGLQNVKAEEEKGMRPLSDLAAGLGMNYAFAESWAPEYGNALFSRFPIKQWTVQRIYDDSDFRNVMKATIEVPRAGEVNFHCTHLDHLNENWRMKHINSILLSNDGPHILAGGLNALDETDYSAERWANIVKYHEDIGKPTPKVQVMKFLKASHYVDAKNFAGECEAVVVLAKGQDVQGTCKYGTRVDYILASPNSPYKFVPGSYEVLSSKGTSDHHIVKVDIVIDNRMSKKERRSQQRKKRCSIVR